MATICYAHGRKFISLPPSCGSLWRSFDNAGTLRSLRILGVVLAIGLVQFVTAPAEAAWTLVFKDNGATAWQSQFAKVGAGCSSISRVGAALRVKGCAFGIAGNKSVFAWARKSVSAGVKIEVDFTNVSAAVIPGGSITAIMLFASGDGAAGFPNDVTTWAAQCCTFPNSYSGHMRGLQLNFAYRNDPTTGNLMRLRGLKGSGTTAAPSDYYEIGVSPSTFPFTNGRSYHMTLIRLGDRLTVSVKDNATGVTQPLVGFTHPYIGKLGAGRIGFRNMSGRDAAFTNLRIYTGS